jgi:hypothetical protein
MHITLDLRCNKAFINRRVVVCLGLACVAEKVSSQKDTGVRLDIITTDGSTFSNT